MKFSAARPKLPTVKNSLLALLSAILLILAFPDFDFWFLAYLALAPLLFAVEREKHSIVKSFVLGWIFGIGFFFGSCWWLTFAPTTYGGVPWFISYALLFIVTLIVGLFPAFFAAIFSLFLKRFGFYAFLFAPFLWTATEFLRFGLTGNNWNAIGYSQAFASWFDVNLQVANVGGVYLTGFAVLVWNAFLSSALVFYKGKKLKSLKRAIILTALAAYVTPLLAIVSLIADSKLRRLSKRKKSWRKFRFYIFAPFCAFLFLATAVFFLSGKNNYSNMGSIRNDADAFVVAVQPNVPMSDLKYGDWGNLRARHIELAERAIENIPASVAKENEKYGDFDLEFAKAISKNKSKIVIFPESPRNFEHESDRELKSFLRDFAVRNNASVLFNSAQPNARGTNLFNSAVLINARGEKVAQYDKIHLVPFGETVPVPEPLAQFVPTMVGNFETGDKYNLLPLGDDLKGGVMICFESHFASLSREYALEGADVLIEMTNDGYLGKTPILRQHLANAVFRAVETNRPIVRVTNVGITAYINERGEVLDALDSYTQGARVWTISKSDGAQTFYVRFGDWFAWLCSTVSLALLFFSFRKGKTRL
ncbi:MAG: apolipoprotein N-acyltransferase [Gemmatimonadaceae bacterium]